MNIEISRSSKDRDVPGMVLGQLTRLDSAIEKEFTLVSDRMTWMTISESFIFGAFVTVAVNYKPGVTYLGDVATALLVGLPTLGILIAAFALHAIQAAHTAADDLKKVRETLEKAFQGDLYVQLISSKLAAHAQGNVPPRYLPWIIIFSWLAFLSISATQLWTSQTTVSWAAVGILFALFIAIVLLVSHLIMTRINYLEAEVKTLKKLQKTESNPPDKVLQMG